MFSLFINRFRMISLKWKLLIPYLFFSFVGTTSLVLIGLNSQQEIIKEEEKQELLRYYDIFQITIRQKAEQALAMATVIAENPIIEDLLWKQDRSALLDYVQPLFGKLKKDFGIKQLHFHILPGKSYLRVHKPEQSGEMIAYRTSIMDVLKTGKGTRSLEWGLTGLGIRGIVPVFRNKELTGSMEIGYPFGRSFLEKQTKRWGPDFSVYEKKGPHTYTLLASTKKSGKKFSPSESLATDALEKTQIFIAPPGFPDIALLAGPLRDYRGEVVAVVEIEVNRSAIVQRLSQTRTLMVVVALVGICVSFFLVWVVTMVFIHPIKEIVAAAQEIAQGKRETRLNLRSKDEIGVLGLSLNTMLNSLKERRLQIQEYARTLERRVQERTADLVSSEEKYRTLVDNLPVGVYRILCDGTIEFVNPYLIDTLGFDPEDMLGNRFFWQEKVWGHDEAQSKETMDILKEDPLGFRRERVVMDKQGQKHVFIDHAIPS